MKLSVGRMCRGQGAAYISVDTLVEPSSSVRFTAVSESGTPLPIEAYPRAVDPSGRSSFVLVTPLLDTTHIVIEAAELSTQGDVVSAQSKRLSRFQVKWLSRYNYRAARDDSMKMRDIDRVTYSAQIHINPSVYAEVPDQDSVVVKGVICCPLAEHDIALRLLASDGERVESFVPYLGSRNEVVFEGIRRTEISFSARIPKKATCCLVASGANGSREGFMCFDRASREYYASLFSPHMYRRSSSERWSDIMKDRLRRLECVDSHDYPSDGPLFSIVVPLYNTPIAFFREMVESVIAQVYQKWELVLVNSTPDNIELSSEISQISDQRVKVVTLRENAGISGNTNAGIDAATGDFVVFFDHDDILDPMALFEYASALNSEEAIDALYCDEDFLNEKGEFIAPHFKSDFNLDLLRCHNYITHLLAVRAHYAKALKLDSAFDGAQDYDFLLRLVEKTQRIHHVRQVLYHWRMSETSTAKSSGNKGYADDAGRRALQEHYNRQHFSARASLTDAPCFYHTEYDISGNPKVSIIIPNKDSVSVLARCIESLAEKTTYSNFEVLVVENNSEEEETFEYYRSAEKRYGFLRIIFWEHEFNYSAINNFGAEYATGDYILLLNNDVEVIEPSWLSSMVSFCQREDVGVVGAKLLYPDDTIQHAGVFMIACQNVNELGGPIHAFSHLDRSDSGYMRRASLVQDVSIVTGACLMTKASLFKQLGGLDEQFAVAFNDVDYCLRVRDEGYLVVFDPDAVLYHYESFSRGSDAGGKNAGRFVAEQGKLRTRWGNYYLQGDPYFGPFATMV